jgi:type IV pilus assembly protein PilM
MSLFKKNETEQKAYLSVGLDIGTLGIKMVVLQREQGKPRLVTYGEAQVRHAGETAEHFLQDPQKSGRILRALFSEADIAPQNVTVGLCAADVFSSIVSVPTLPEEGFAGRVLAQAEKISPFPLAEMLIDSAALSVKDASRVFTSQDNNSYTRVLVTGAPKKLVEQYSVLCEAGGFTLSALETEVFAMIRSLVGPDMAPTALVDIGGARTTITVVRAGTPYLVRTIAHAGVAVTRSLAKSAGISFAQAERMKRDFAYASDTALPKALEEAFAPIIHELRYALDLYDKQEFQENVTVDKILLTGGMSLVGNLAEYFTKTLGITTHVANTFSYIATVPESRAMLEEIGPRFSVAAGLALRNMVTF